MINKELVKRDILIYALHNGIEHNIIDEKVILNKIMKNLKEGKYTECENYE